jgi:hypothetical protein
MRIGRSGRSLLAYWQKVLVIAAAISAVSFYGSVIFALGALLLTWGPIAFLRVFGRCLLALLLVMLALTAPLWMFKLATWPKRSGASRANRPPQQANGTLTLSGRVRQWIALSHAGRRGRAAPAPKEHVASQPITSLQAAAPPGDVHTSFRGALRLWAGIMAVLLLEAVAATRLRPASYPLFQIAVNFALATLLPVFMLARNIRR